MSPCAGWWRGSSATRSSRGLNHPWTIRRPPREAETGARGNARTDDGRGRETPLSQESPTVSGSGGLEARQRRRESSPPNHPASRASSECPILTKFSVVPAQPPRSLPVVASQTFTVPGLEVTSRLPSGLNATD